MNRHDDGYFPTQREEVHHPTSEDYFSQIVPRASRQKRQEASEASVEALDLADYAKTLRARQAEDPYPPFPAAATGSSSRSTQPLHSPKPTYPPSSYPPSSFPHFSRVDTLSSGKTSTTATHRTPQSTHSLPVAGPSSRKRPFSLPNNSLPQIGRNGDPEEEVDVTQFPSWTRDWYGGDARPSRRAGPDNDLDQLEAYELQAGFAPPKAFMNGSRSSLKNSKQQSPFDPGYIHPQSYPKAYDPYDDNMSYPSYAAPSYSNHEPLLGHNSGRDGVAPWSLDPPEYKSAPLDPQVKEERIRMLEHEFGSGKGKKKDRERGDSEDQEKRIKDDGLLRDDDGKLIVGTPDGKGGLATSGPKTRGAIRWLQVALAVAVGGPIIYAGVALKPNSAPPPSGKPPFFILGVLGPVTFLLLLYLFAIRPCTRRRRYASSAPLTHPGAMILPVNGPLNGKKGKPGKGQKMPGGKKGKKYQGGAMPGDVQVNLIVDPNAFAMPEDDISSSDSEEIDAGGFPAGFFDKNDPRRTKPKDRAKERAKRKRNKRRTIMASLKLEEEWKAARSWLRITSVIDTFASIFWAVAFGFVMAGKRCPTGGKEAGYGGWCTAYNASTAAACLLSVAFAVSLYFDVKDLYASKASPRTRV